MAVGPKPCGANANFTKSIREICIISAIRIKKYFQGQILYHSHIFFKPMMM